MALHHRNITFANSKIVIFCQIPVCSTQGEQHLKIS